MGKKMAYKDVDWSSIERAWDNVKWDYNWDMDIDFDWSINLDFDWDIDFFTNK